MQLKSALCLIAVSGITLPASAARLARNRYIQSRTEVKEATIGCLVFLWEENADKVKEYIQQQEINAPGYVAFQHGRKTIEANLNPYCEKERFVNHLGPKFGFHVRRIFESKQGKSAVSMWMTEVSDST